LLSKKLASITPSFTIGISTKVNEMKRNGIAITNLSIGEPDFFTPERAKAAGIQAIEMNKTKYDAAEGLRDLREAICLKLKEENSMDYKLDEIVVSSGAKHSITNALMALLDPGDEVLIPKPYWVSYPEMVKLTGGVPVFVETQRANDFKVTVEDLKACLSDRTKAIFITNPSNPTGAVYSREELLPIAEFLVDKGVYIIADEIYEKIVFDQTFTSIASLSEAIKEMTITVNGMSKSTSMTGWRIGYTASTRPIAKAMATIQGHLVSHPATISQYAALESLSCKEEMAEMKNAYAKRRDLVSGLLSEIEGIDFVRPEGAFYVFIDVSAFKSKLPASDSLSIQVCDLLLEKFQLALVPGIAFGLDNYVRASTAASEDTLREGMSKLAAFAASLK
jgi:aspartate aminotransferase